MALKLPPKVFALESYHNDGNIDISDAQLTKLIVIEFLIKSLPTILFLLLAFVRFTKIRSIGFYRTTIYSKMFICKIIGQWIILIIYLVIILLAFALPESWSES